MRTMAVLLSLHNSPVPQVPPRPQVRRQYPGVFQCLNRCIIKLRRRPMSNRSIPMKSQKTKADQSARFIEAAKKIGADETGKKFERAFKKVVKAKKPNKADN